jgi:CubicO group peptidase (beta-lactamase class C family)
MLSKLFTPDGPGGTAFVSKKGKVIYKKAFDRADLELNVPMEADMNFRIGVHDQTIYKPPQLSSR